MNKVHAVIAATAFLCGASTGGIIAHAKTQWNADKLLVAALEQRGCWNNLDQVQVEYYFQKARKQYFDAGNKSDPRYPIMDAPSFYCDILDRRKIPHAPPD